MAGMYEQLEEYDRNPLQNTKHEEVSLQRLIAPERARIDESEFLNRWIALFWEREKYPEVAAAWVDRVSLSPRNEVEIVSDGEVVGIVPAMLGPSVTDFITDHRATLGAVSASAIATGNNFPRLGETYLRSSLQQYQQQVSSRPEVKAAIGEYRNQWADLFTKYGLLQSVSEQAVIDTGPKQNELNEDQFDDIIDDF